MLVQGEAPRSALLREFKVTPQRRPARDLQLLAGRRRRRRRAELRDHRQDPVRLAGRSDHRRADRAINAEGRSAFGEYQIPLAILTLQQGLGRLIRHRQDRGVLAILDPRLRTMGYGRRFLASLPPAPVTHRLRRHRAILRRENWPTLSPASAWCTLKALSSCLVVVREDSMKFSRIGRAAVLGALVLSLRRDRGPGARAERSVQGQGRRRPEQADGATPRSPWLRPKPTARWRRRPTSQATFGRSGSRPATTP